MSLCLQPTDLQIHFRPTAELAGASISTFLLERGRVTDSRPFHIITLLRERETTGTTPPALAKVETALNALGIEGQDGMWSVLRGIDYLIAGDMKAAAAALGLDPALLDNTLSIRTVKAGMDSFNWRRQGDELRAAQYGLVRSLYSWLFDWLVIKINAALDAPTDGSSYISLVDIFGFESFKSNALAQFLINWANEQLQRQLSKDVLEAQAEAYAAEGIDFGAPAVQPSCLDLLSNKPGRPGQTGIAYLLDDQTRRQTLGLGGTDELFASSIGTECYSLHGLVTRRANAHPHEFTVVHYGHNVTYDTRGFLTANSERVDDNLRDVLARSGSSFVRDLVVPQNSAKAPPGRSAFTSVVSSFRKSLDQLNSLLTTTNVHYIHCIKANNAAAPWAFHRDVVELQVEATGITQIARFARECGPYLVKRDAMNPYLLVLESHTDLDDAVRQLSAIVGDADGKAVQLGQSHVFFRAAALTKIEEMLSSKIAVVVSVQSHARRLLARARYAAAKAEAERKAREEAERRAREEAERKAKEEARRAAELKAREEAKAKERAAKEAAIAARKATRDRRVSEEHSQMRSPTSKAAALAALTPTRTVTPPRTRTPTGRRVSSTTESKLLNSVDSKHLATPERLRIYRNGDARGKSPVPYYPKTPEGVRTPEADELSNSPLYSQRFIKSVVHDLVGAATDHDTAYTVGTLLARTVAWYHGADLRYVPELLTPELLLTVRNTIGRGPSLPHLWLLAVLVNVFRHDAGHRPARQMATVERELLDMIVKEVYKVSKEVLDSIIPARRRSGGGNMVASVTPTKPLTTIWTELEGFPLMIREATAEAIISRVLQVVIQGILTGEISDDMAAAVDLPLEQVFEWRERANLHPSPLETVLKAMLGTMSGLKTPPPSFVQRFESLRIEKHPRHPTNTANAALLALTDHPPIDITLCLEEALHDDTASWNTVQAVVERLDLTDSMTEFLRWFGQFKVGSGASEALASPSPRYQST